MSIKLLNLRTAKHNFSKIENSIFLEKLRQDGTYNYEKKKSFEHKWSKKKQHNTAILVRSVIREKLVLASKLNLPVHNKITYK